MYILPTSPETEQQRFIERRKLYRSQSSLKRQSCTTLAYLLLFYFITLFVVPALLILNIAIFVKEWDVFTAARDGTEVVCHNAVYALIGYIVVYALLFLWIVVYAILNTQVRRPPQSSLAAWLLSARASPAHLPNSPLPVAPARRRATAASRRAAAVRRTRRTSFPSVVSSCLWRCWHITSP